MKHSQPSSIEAEVDRPMRATEVLQKRLGDALESLHALSSRVLLRSIET